VFPAWITSTEHYWATSRERRRQAGDVIGFEKDDRGRRSGNVEVQARGAIGGLHAVRRLVDCKRQHVAIKGRAAGGIGDREGAAHRVAISTSI
jgi:hypothetical protein